MRVEAVNLYLPPDDQTHRECRVVLVSVLSLTFVKATVSVVRDRHCMKELPSFVTTVDLANEEERLLFQVNNRGKHPGLPSEKLLAWRQCHRDLENGVISAIISPLL